MRFFILTPLRPRPRVGRANSVVVVERFQAQLEWIAVRSTLAPVTALVLGCLGRRPPDKISRSGARR
ncbi:hypothetical protein AGR7A_pAt20312 [Agrobacterium deltaense NCPPB 1641]|uniref:Uncharacterized protein n=1 Tax=Agrobacterium deltaense NCPPB 1641 TaxID=1183425 RepID=A0A1S7UA13_9HYPH|nr:hypothetical protein AGR7A_pAt20312 [Agrobacterium deltaense NCPPB 1641]